MNSGSTEGEILSIDYFYDQESEYKSNHFIDCVLVLYFFWWWWWFVNYLVNGPTCFFIFDSIQILLFTSIRGSLRMPSYWYLDYIMITVSVSMFIRTFSDRKPTLSFSYGSICHFESLTIVNFHLS